MYRSASRYMQKTSYVSSEEKAVLREERRAARDAVDITNLIHLHEQAVELQLRVQEIHKLVRAAIKEKNLLIKGAPPIVGANLVKRPVSDLLDKTNKAHIVDQLKTFNYNSIRYLDWAKELLLSIR